MRIAVIGQSAFAVDVYHELKKNGHEVVGVFTVPDKNGKEDVLGGDSLAKEATSDGVKVFKFQRWRLKGKVIADVLSQYKSVDAELNVLPFCSQFIPMDVITYPTHQSIIYHPSILPKHRGASAINWTLIEGDAKAGFSVFWADDGLDTGPILLQKECDVLPDDTVSTIYNRFLYPEGVKGMAEAVEMINEGNAPRINQSEEGASYEPYITTKPELAELKFDQPAQKIHNFIRGNDKVPGAWALFNGEKVTFYGSSLWSLCTDKPADSKSVAVDGGPTSGIVFLHSGGMLMEGNDGLYVNVGQVKLANGRTVPASKFGQEEEESVDVDLSPAEAKMAEEIKAIWRAVLNVAEIEDDTDFFACGAGSMDVTRLVEEIKFNFKVGLANEDVYMGPTYADFVKTVVFSFRGGNGKKEIVFDAVEMDANRIRIRFPHQMFINGEFLESESGRTYEVINPHDESVICKVTKGSKADVDMAVTAAKRAFDEGEWGKMSARARGRLLYRLADVMEEHLEELATIESIDSGAVYTLAIKTHVGMSIETWRYFAGWCDKIQGTTIPISHARPNNNLTLTKKEPIGVCGLVTPWNYPLMMLSWKMAACLAAGNTVVHKPAQVCPLTALKFAELSVKAGIPPGVINILPGSGSEIGQAIAEHADVRKLGFTGSTPIGAQIMKSCAVSNLKRVSLELGGKSPLIIFSDCDLDKAVRQSMGAVFFNKGENCIAAGRLFVAGPIHNEFVKRVVAETRKLIVGDPLDRSTSHGPQNHRAHLEKLIEYCDRGIKDGATLVLGGKQVNRPGLYFEPTIFTDVDDGNYIATEESFGPIMIISKFEEDQVDEVLRRANRTEFGLASGVFSNDVSRVLRIAEKLDAGTVFINCYNKTDVAAPFGGFKQSGCGKDLGEEALHEYLRTKTITIEY